MKDKTKIEAQCKIADSIFQKSCEKQLEQIRTNYEKLESKLKESITKIKKKNRELLKDNLKYKKKNKELENRIIELEGILLFKKEI